MTTRREPWMTVTSVAWDRVNFSDEEADRLLRQAEARRETLKVDFERASAFVEALRIELEKERTDR